MTNVLFHFLKFYFQLFRLPEKSFFTLMDQRIRFVIALMQKDLRRGLTLDEMAKAAKLSRFHFCHLFKAEIGGAPAKYFKWLRMQKAKELLEATDFSVKEIVAMVGVHDDSHFVRDFEMACGLTPARYRANHRGNGIRTKRAGGMKKAISANE